MKSFHFKRTCLFLALLVCFTGAFPAYAQEPSRVDLSMEEQAYIRQKKVLKVAMVDDWRPVAFKKHGQSSHYGLVVDILRELEDETGLSVEFVDAENYRDAIQMAENGTVDIVGVAVNYTGTEQSYLIEVTSPYLETDLMMIYSKKTDLGDLPSLVLAQIKGQPQISDNPMITYLEFDTRNECLLAVRTGEADATYCNTFTGMEYIQRYDNRELAAIPIDVEVQFRFGVNPGENPILKELLEQTLTTMSRRGINNSLTHNRTEFSSSLGNFVYHYPFEIICAVLIIASLIILTLILYMRTKNRHSVSLYGYETSYRILADTVGGIGLNYNCAKDTLTIFGKHADQIAIPAEIPSCSDYLEKPDKGISLTIQQLEQMLVEGMTGEAHDIILKCKTADGNWQHFHLVFSVLSTDEAYQKPISLVGYLTNEEAEFREKENLLRMSRVDKLTGLYNRPGAEAEIEKYLKSNNPQNDILLIIDVDQFKEFNDSYGHDCGDDVLKDVGCQLQQVFRKRDVICRWGGDEFFVYLFGAASHIEQIDERCQLLRERMKQYQYNEWTLPVTLSIGGAVVGKRTLEETFKRADQALYSVKKNGRDAAHVLRK